MKVLSIISFKHNLSLLLAFVLLLGIFAAKPNMVHAATHLVGTAEELQIALNNIASGDTIKLMYDITYNSSIVTNKTIIFDLNGRNLSATSGVSVHNGGNILLANPDNGQFNVSRRELPINADIESVVLILTGRLEITNIYASGNTDHAVSALGGELVIFGDVVHTGSSGCGVYAFGNSQVTINGELKVSSGVTYISFNGTDITQEQYEPTSSKPGYYEYKATGSYSSYNQSRVWVRTPPPPPTSRMTTTATNHVTTTVITSTQLPITTTTIIMPNITQHPQDHSIAAWQGTSFSITTSGSYHYQWQCLPLTSDLTKWEDLSDGDIYSGTTTTTLTLKNVPASCNGYQFRCMVIVDGSVGIPSNAATLTVTGIYTVTVNSGMGNGSYYAGSIVTITANAAPPNMIFDKWTASSNSVVFASTTSMTTNFIMPAVPVSVTATYIELLLPTSTPEQPAPTYIINAQNDGNGVAFASPSSAIAGTQITIEAIPNSGYEFKEWQVEGGGLAIFSNMFTMPSANVTIKAVFEQLPIVADPVTPTPSDTTTAQGSSATTLPISDSMTPSSGDTTSPATTINDDDNDNGLNWPWISVITLSTIIVTGATVLVTMSLVRKK